jgi:hypothetical protein
MHAATANLLAEKIMFQGVNESTFKSTKLVNAQSIHEDLLFVLSSEGKSGDPKNEIARLYSE